MAKKPRTMACPTCHKTVQTTDEHFPFCSERCRLIDLGKWASGAYRISSPILDPEVLEQVERHPDGSEDDSDTEERKRS